MQIINADEKKHTTKAQCNYFYTLFWGVVFNHGSIFLYYVPTIILKAIQIDAD